MVDKEGPADSEDEYGIGVVNGLSYDMITDAKKDIFESMQCELNEISIPSGAFSAEFTATEFSHEEGQMTFPETGQWDFAPHWEMKLKLNGFSCMPDELINEV